MNAESTSTQWNIDETRRLVNSRWGPGQLWKIRPVLRASTVRMLHANYHYAEYQRIVSTHVDERLAAGTDIWTIGLPGSRQESDQSNLFFIQCEAHLFACAQAIHATCDILAHVVFYALGLNLGSEPFKRRVDLHSIADFLKKTKQADARLVPLSEEFELLRQSAEFLEINALVNQLKHHGGPTVNLALEPAEGQPYEVRFDEFQRPDGSRPAKAAKQVLGSAYERVNVATVNIGRALNVWLHACAPATAAEATAVDAEASPS
ncbi:hypothetical protein RQP53_14275 [Paucibacter sp. APW11]|uniref:HEPN domain-containing protein n=1 Tax=Roseateles aquae TaxID=3077235 RepID=A0ABU3PD27_9BURK|nr:hypothetical protein [Paucibacter sp. APW11]MDT9000438.1 hypothetical protein [Paucibacter sp. APW11]